MTATIIETAVTKPKPASITATTEQKALLEGLKFVSAALPTRPAISVLLGVKITARVGGLTLNAYDLDMSVTEHVDGSGRGAVLAPGRLLLDLVRALDSGPLQLTTEGKQLVLTQGDMRFTVPLLPLADYPELPDLTVRPTSPPCPGGAHLAAPGVRRGRQGLHAADLDGDPAGSQRGHAQQRRHRPLLPGAGAQRHRHRR